MAGLIQNEMEQMPVDEAQMVEGEVAAEVEADESDPTYQEALAVAMEALYGAEAAVDISKQLKAMGNVVDGMATVAYDVTAAIDERTDGMVPDELLVPLAMQVLEEVVEIADATGLNPQPEDVALAFKQMILRFLQEQGVDTSQLDQAMSEVDPAVFRMAAEEEQEPAA